MSESLLVLSIAPTPSMRFGRLVHVVQKLSHMGLGQPPKSMSMVLVPNLPFLAPGNLLYCLSELPLQTPYARPVGTVRLCPTSAYASRALISTAEITAKTSAGREAWRRITRTANATTGTLLTAPETRAVAVSLEQPQVCCSRTPRISSNCYSHKPLSFARFSLEFERL